MKFDTVRAWKDENYRQELSADELNGLPANPAGELDETEMALVNGGGGQDVGGFGAGGAASSSSAAFSRHHRICSFALICPISVFSIGRVTLGILDLPDLIGIANTDEQICIHHGC